MWMWAGPTRACWSGAKGTDVISRLAKVSRAKADPGQRNVSHSFSWKAGMEKVNRERSHLLSFPTSCYRLLLRSGSSKQQKKKQTGKDIDSRNYWTEEFKRRSQCCGRAGWKHGRGLTSDKGSFTTRQTDYSCSSVCSEAVDLQSKKEISFTFKTVSK